MITPGKLKKGDEVRVIAPARSISLVGEKNIRIAINNLEYQGFKVTFGQHVREMDEFQSSSIQSRIQDLHDAFLDKNVKAILTVIGGYNTNQLLDYIDYNIIRKNPKIFCGFSDITAIATAITTITGMITYSGLHFSTWAMERGFEYNLEYFNKCLLNDNEYEIIHSESWSDDLWYIDQDNRNFINDKDYWVINQGESKGSLIGGHLRSLASLQGTRYMPSLKNSILLIEEDSEINGPLFDRLLQSLIHQKDFSGVLGIMIGRFQKSSQISKEELIKIIKTKKELSYMPIVANADFGHTNPLITFPIGGTIYLKVDNKVICKVIIH